MFLAMVPGQILTERFSGMIVARFKNQKITIQDSETKMYDSDTKMTATKAEAIQKQKRTN